MNWKFHNHSGNIQYNVFLFSFKIVPFLPELLFIFSSSVTHEELANINLEQS